MKQRREYPLLAGAALLGAIAVYIEISRTSAQSPDHGLSLGDADAQRVAARSASPAAERPAPTGNPLWTIPLKQLAMTPERPIFSPSRRPPPPPAGTPVYVAPVAPRPPAAEPERPAISLVGTVASRTEGIGVFIEPATRNIVRLRLGEHHQGWVLRSVKGREATLEKNSETTVLELPPPGGEAAMLANSSPPEELPARRPPRQ